PAQASRRAARARARGERVIRVIARALRSIAQTPGLFLAASTSVAISLLLGGAFLLTGVNAKRWIGTLIGSGSIVVYLRPEVDQAHAPAVARMARALADVKQVTIESPEDAARKLVDLLGSAVGDSGADPKALNDALGWSLLVQAESSAAVPEL